MSSGHCMAAVPTSLAAVHTSLAAVPTSLAVAHTGSQQLWLPAQDQASLTSIVDGQGEPFAQELQAVIGCWGGESYFSLDMVTCGLPMSQQIVPHPCTYG